MVVGYDRGERAHFEWLAIVMEPFGEAFRPLREMEMTKEEKKVVRGFMFLSEKPILYVLNISESTTLMRMHVTMGK